jgi:RHS repeat-associated protein
MGKPAPAPVEGDTLAGFVADLTPAQFDAFFDAADPHASAGALLQGASTRIVYDLDRFRRTRLAHPTDPSQWQPVCAATLTRETHVSSPAPPHGLRIQLNFSYSDGFGREIQQKIQAEPGPLEPDGGVIDPRWVGSGWTIFNNKGKPVRQYEPFFSLRRRPDGSLFSDHRFEFGAAAGVSPVLFYDPLDRVVATLHPNHTYEKVVFDAWQQTTYDVNDTCAPRNAETGDPRTDSDIAGFVTAYFATLPDAPAGVAWQTWYAQRRAGARGPDEQNAAVRAAGHADTPTTSHLDTLGRTFLSVARNRTVCSGHDLDGREDAVATRFDVDLQGRQRAIHDERRLPAGNLPVGAAEPRVVMNYDYDIIGNRIRQIGMDGGTRWTLDDAAGKPIRTWDSRGHAFRTTYDALRRPVEQTVRGTIAAGDAASDPRTLAGEILFDRIEYGEPPANATAAEETLAQRLNLRARVYRRYDSAGVATNARLDAADTPLEAYDFKGNLLRSTRRLATRYREIPDWSQDPRPPLEAERFESGTRYDALNRPVQTIAPHSNLPRATITVTQPLFNEANLLERVDVWLERASEPSGLLDAAADAPSPIGVADIDYDAKGQRLQIAFKNGASTEYGYDPDTFRLIKVFTQRGAGFTADCANPQACGVQNVHYVYDPAGNITHAEDDAQQTIFFRNQRIEPSGDYVYDALYRLIQASSREHLGQDANGDRQPPTAPGGFDAFHIRRDHPNVLRAMGAYTERYVYDTVGNLLQMQHRGTDPGHAGWTRVYEYSERSAIEGTGASPKMGNRLTRTTLDPNASLPVQVEAYQHDAHGNISRLPHLGAPGQNVHWDCTDRMSAADRGGGGAAFFAYDASGQRVRSVWEKTPGLVEERIYLGGVEIFRKHGGPIGANSATFERETLHVMDDTQRIALVETRTLDTAGSDPAPRQAIRYQHANHLGSSSLELDEHADIVSYEEYTPYGSSSYQAVRSQLETPKRYRFNGKECDEATGLHYFGARYYADWLGRWTSVDPIGLKDSLCVYEYVRGNPIRYRDRDGRLLEEGFLGGTAAGTGTGAAEGTALGVGGTTVAAGAGLITIAIVAVPLIVYAGQSDIESRTERYTAEARAKHEEAVRNQKQEEYYEPPTEKSAITAAKLLGKDPKQARLDYIRRRNEADNLVEDGVLTRREADEYIRTGILNQEQSRDRRASGVNFRFKASRRDYERYDAIPTGHTVVYTIRDHAGKVLYAGVTTKKQGPEIPDGREPLDRLVEHLGTKDGELLGLAAEFRIEGSYELMDDAAALEQSLITEHDPMFNKDLDSYNTRQAGHPKAPLPKWAEPLDPAQVPEPNLDIRIGIEPR